MNNETFDKDFTWYEWTFVPPEDAPSTEEPTEQSDTWTSTAVGEWGEEWVWMT
jgi:hypothetical protein